MCQIKILTQAVRNHISEKRYTTHYIEGPEEEEQPQKISAQDIILGSIRNVIIVITFSRMGVHLR